MHVQIRRKRKKKSKNTHSTWPKSEFLFLFLFLALDLGCMYTTKRKKNDLLIMNDNFFTIGAVVAFVHFLFCRKNKQFFVNSNGLSRAFFLLLLRSFFHLLENFIHIGFARTFCSKRREIERKRATTFFSFSLSLLIHSFSIPALSVLGLVMVSVYCVLFQIGCCTTFIHSARCTLACTN